MVVAVEAHRIAYMAVPKAACSSVKAALAVADPAVPDARLADVGTDPMAIHAIYPTRRFRPHRWRAYEGWFRFTVVRDPLRRLLSLYTDVIAERRLLHNSANFRRARAPLPQDPDPDTFFLNLRGYMSWASVVKHHALPMRLFTGPDLSDYDRVYRTAELPDLAGDLTRLSGRKVTIPRLNASRTTLRFDSLATPTRAALRDWLAPEYETYSALFDPPW